MSEQLKPSFSNHYRCDNCQKEFRQTTAYSPDSSLKITYCENCVEMEEEICSFRGTDDKTQQYLLCDKPLFDKKKQLCRSHNRQVWKRFNEFTKDMSVSSTAAWLETWNQSQDWKYFWNLGKESEKKDPSTGESLNSDEPTKSFSSTKKQKSWGAAPIHETTENIQSLNIDKRTLKKTGRIHLFATRVKKEWIERLKSIAYEERLHYNEVLERALECYEKQRRK